jgi:hypothetical protein
MKITIRVIGVRFELNDPYICVIGKLLDQTQNAKSNFGDERRGRKPSINILQNEFDE